MKQSAIIALFVGAISASSIKQHSADYTLPETNICTNANKATTVTKPAPPREIPLGTLSLPPEPHSQLML